MSKAKQTISNKIGSALSNLALVIAVIICLTVVVQVTTNGYVQIGGFSLFRIVTGSMEPELPVGSLIVCQDVPVSQIQERDIVCFRSKNPQILGQIVTHRVINTVVREDGSVLLETKGDANLSADAEYVTQDNLIGKVNYYSKDRDFMASFVNILTDKIGFLILILFPTLLIAGFILRSCMNNMRRDIDRALEKEKRKKEEENVLYTSDEYAAMMERIKAELLEEMKLGVGENGEQGTKDSKTE
jgi:signal peptidase I